MKANLQPLMSSMKQDWETPQAFFDKLDEEFQFTWDVCATHLNTKVIDRYYGTDQYGASCDGLVMN